jgi:hypothetical protein
MSTTRFRAACRCAALAVTVASLATTAAGAQARPSVPERTAPARVTGLSPTVDPRMSNGPCPAAFTFTTLITANHYPVTVEYQWERSDGAKGQKQSIELTHAGTPVTETWKLGGAGTKIEIWERLHVLTPNDMKSGTPKAKLVCK